MNKKGITAVVAIVLLLMMTVGAAGLAYVWITNLQTKMQGNAETGVEDIQKTQDARISVDSVWNASGNINLTLLNSGRYTFTNPSSSFRIYLDGQPLNTGVAGLTSGTFAPRDRLTIQLPTTAPGKMFPSFGNVTTIKISTDIEGITATFRCAPSSPTATSC